MRSLFVFLITIEERNLNSENMALKEKNGNTFPHVLFKVGDLVTFQLDDTLKDGIILVVDAYGTFESPNIPSYDIIVEEENMLYEHVKYDLVKSYK